MNRIDVRKRVTQVGAAVLLASSAFAYADGCGGKERDGTGMECTGVQSANDLSATESHLLTLKGRVITAELRVAQAKRSVSQAGAEQKNAELRVVQAKRGQSEASAEVAYADANLRAARRAVSDAEKTADYR